jgi:hypothetical protein
MRLYGCATCKYVYRVGSVEPEELNGVWAAVEPTNPSCPTPLCRGKLQKIRPGAAISQLEEVGYRVREIPFRTFYRAVYGFGGPKGEAAELEKFTHLLQTKKIVDVVARAIGQPERVILNRLTLEDGTILHFDSSARGACCYYIEEPGPSCMEVVENEFRSGSATEGSDTDREEARRVTENSGSYGTETGGVGHTADAFAVECSKPGSVSSLSIPDNIRESTKCD